MIAKLRNKKSSNYYLRLKIPLEWVKKRDIINDISLE